jgi:sulfite dehydrogenase (cytochrome) subunit B
MKRISLAFVIGSVCWAANAAPVTIDLPEPRITLKPASGSDITTNTCGACHSLDYIAIQPPHMGDAFWDAEVTKMIKTYGAPINDNDADAIRKYLKSNY